MVASRQSVDQPRRLGPSPTAMLKPVERIFIEKNLLRLYPRLQRQDLWPWKLWHGPLIPDFYVRGTQATIRRIVIVHCGDGVLANLLALLFPHIEIVGLDPDPEKIAYARSTVGQRTNLKFLCGHAATFTAIPCDRIIYQHCLSQSRNSIAFKKLLVKTLRWLTPHGDFIVQESPVRLLGVPRLWQGMARDMWRRKAGVEGYLCGLLAEIGYPAPVLYACRHVPNAPATEVFCRYPRQASLRPLDLKRTRGTVSEWQDVGDQSADSVLGFLFADAQRDFSRELL